MKDMMNSTTQNAEESKNGMQFLSSSTDGSMAALKGQQEYQ